MTRPARSIRRATQQAEAAADPLFDWLRSPRGTVPDESNGTPGVIDDAAASLRGDERPLPDTIAAAATTRVGDHDGVRPAYSRERPAFAGAPLRLAHTDWLHHRLVAAGRRRRWPRFRRQPAVAERSHGSSIWIAWREDLFHLLIAPPPPQRRRLSLDGARMLASQLREAAALRHDAGTARVGCSRACPFDLHALVPVPPDVLHLGPDHPDALAWLWAHGGTTAPLRHVAAEPAPAWRAPLPPGAAAVRLIFWSADWTPWQALAAVAACWPALRFVVRPTYGVL